MSQVFKIIRKFRTNATDEELHPIVMSNEEHSKTGNEGSRENIELKSNQGTIQIAPLPEPSSAALRDQSGGYLGPASFDPQERYALPGEVVPNSNSSHYPRNNQSKLKSTAVPISPPGSVNHNENIFYRQWKSRTGLEQRLLVVTCSLSLVVLVVLIGVAILSNAVLKNPSLIQLISGGETTTYCQTPECIVAAGNIIKWMNHTADPCKNFVEYTCGGWKSLNPLPEKMNRWDNFAILRQMMNFRIKSLLEKKPIDTEAKSKQSAKRAYQACTDDKTWHKLGMKPLLDQINNISKFPLIDPDWEDDDFDFASTYVKLRNVGASYLVSVYVTADSYNTSRNMLKVDLGPLPTRNEYLLANDSEIRELEIKRIRILSKTLYHHLLDGEDTSDDSDEDSANSLNVTSTKATPGPSNSLATSTIDSGGEVNQPNNDNETGSSSSDTLEDTLSGDRRSKRQSKMSSDEIKDIQEQDAIDLWEFWIKVAQIMPTIEQQLNITRRYNLMTVKEFQETSIALLTDEDDVQIDWLSVFNEMLQNAGIQITDSEEIIVKETKFIQEFLKLINETPKRILANSLMYHFMLEMGEEVTPSITSILEKESLLEDHSEFGRRHDRPWVDCSYKVNVLLSMAVSSLYVQTYFSQQAKKEAEVMVNDLIESFKDGLYSLDWIDEVTRKGALDKVNKMSLLVAYPEFLLNNQELDDYYENLPDIVAEDHYGNVIKLQIYNSVRGFKRLREAPRNDRWTSGSAVINAFYHLTQNAIVIPAGILQSPFYRPNTFAALNYGGIASVIGHEVTHAFDVKGSMRDADGNVNDWWSSYSSLAYSSKSECFLKQYNNYDQNNIVFGDMNIKNPEKVNGLITQSENIADNGGLARAWRAYKKRISESREDMKLYGLESLTQDQLFFITFAQIWCSSYTDNGLDNIFKFGGHAPGPIRVLGTIRNTKAFAETFKCSESTSVVNSSEICNLW